MRKLSVDLIIFDLDMTLVDSLASIYNCFVYAFEKNGLPRPIRKDVDGLVGFPLEKMAERLLLKAGKEASADLNKAIVESYRERYVATSAKETTLFPGVREVLEHLKEKRLAIVTTKQGELTRRLLDELDLLKYFNLVLGHGDYKNPKPDPEPVFLALEQTKVVPGKGVIIGDTIYDILAGKGAGIHTIGVTWGIDSKEELKIAGAGHVIDDIRELLDIVE